MDKDIQFQIEALSKQLIVMLIEKYGWDLKKAMDEFYYSDTFKRLCDPECGLYYESAVYVFSYLENEMEVGIFK